MATINIELSVTTVAELKQEANAFGNHARELRGIFNQMQSVVSSTKSVWTGTDQQKLVDQFASLQDDMDRFCTMVDEYNEDLQAVARNYESANSSNVSIASSLKVDIQLI